MGNAARAREQAELDAQHYLVRRWTAMPPAGQREEVEDMLTNAAAIIERELRSKRPDVEASVRQVRVAGHPQLLFSIRVRAVDEDHARLRAATACERGLKARIPLPNNTRVRLIPNWGKIEVERGG